MAEYEFRCDDCEHGFVIHQSVFAKLPRSCPKCRKRKNFSTVIGLTIGVRGEPRTVGSLAEKNTKKLCKEDYDAIMSHGKLDGLTPHTMKAIEKAGGTIKEKSGETPWYRNGSIPGLEKSDKPIDISRVKDISKFIETGKKT